MIAKEPIRVPSETEHIRILSESKQVLGKEKTTKNSLETDMARMFVGKRRDELLLSEFKKRMFDAGYNAARDVTDSGFLSDHPIVILDGERSLKLVEIRDLNSSDLEKAKAFVNKRFS